MKSQSVSRLALTSLVLSVALAACTHSKNVDSLFPGGPGPSKGKFSDPRATIAGVDIKGHWLSDCHADEFGDGYRIFDLKYDATTFARKITKYTDSACTNQKRADESHGEYRFVESYASGIYVVEYVFEWQNGITTQGLENVRLTDGKLFIGNMASGEALGVLENAPLHLEGANPGPVDPIQPVEPTPSTKAEPVSSYSEARYAVCVIQGQAWVMDFKGVDLSTVSTGTMRVGRRSCDVTSADVSWYTDVIEYKASMAGGALQIDVTNLSDTYIHGEPGGDGLAKGGFPRGAWTVLMGNSGKCYFTKNTGFDGIPKIL